MPDPNLPARRGPLLRAGLAISHGHLMTSDGAEFAPVRAVDGQFRDILDAADAVTPLYDGLYITDLDGRRRGEPQLDYLQELARDADVWLDPGVRTADEAIDGLVTGARRVVLSSASLESARELRRTWKMSTELVFELVVGSGGEVLALEGDWAGHPPAAVAAAVRSIGIDSVIYTPRGREPDWALLRSLVEEGPVWLGGGYRPVDAASLQDSGATGAIYHLPAEMLVAQPTPAPDPS
ncbi:MAG TPA: HisA/HisF-related TIM barrel protein [Thermoplasmata archaeon]|nr:HisA/HisF-related TIM barrel protein [Thermoplasmata archaeon]